MTHLILKGITIYIAIMNNFEVFGSKKSKK